MLYLTCTIISSVYLAHYGVSHAKDWISVDCGTIHIILLFFPFFRVCLHLIKDFLDKYELNRHLLSTPMGVDYEVIGFDMEVQPLVPTMQLDLYA